MDRAAIIQYERKLKKEIEDKKVFDAIMVLQNCDDYELRKKYKQNLVNLLCAKGYQVTNTPELPIDLEIKMLIRADLKTYILKIEKEELSDLYSQSLEEAYAGGKQFLDIDYQLNMQKSDAWKTISQFTSFQKISKNIVKKMLEKQLSPDVVKKMTVMDYLHFVAKNCKSVFKEYSLKKKFVQTFINHNEEELRKVHHLQGVDVRYTNAMVAAMKSDGIASGIKVFDEKGEPIKGPEYTIHHRIPVKQAGAAQYFSEVNLFKNLVLMEKNIYHKLIHICESSEYIADKRYFSKLLPPSNSVFISGLEPKDVICYDFVKMAKIPNSVLEAISLPVSKEACAVDQKNIKSVAQEREKPKNRKIPYKNRGCRRG